MEQWRTPRDMRAWSRTQRLSGDRIALVPTMGALHEGHRSLIGLARDKAERVVVSIFLNPIQFDQDGDLDSYPRTLEADLATCRELGVDAVYLPERAAMYPEGYATFIEVVGTISEILCALARPGHFRGVCTVVGKLFNAVEPDVAVFGGKDLQQALIVQRLISDLDYGIELVVAPTRRRPDGLALSSRNARLRDADQEAAASIPVALNKVNAAFRAGERESMKLIELFAMEVLVHPDVAVDYAEVVSLSGFEPVEEAGSGCLLAVAVFVGDVRLIDHIYLGGEPIAISEEVG